MTGMEQGLRYIEREIRFMVKDQFGNPSYIKYADRVIEDACGIPNFCSTVLSSKRPLAAILRAVRGPRGDVIMRFFNSALHDTRVEMVMVLAEAIKLRSHNNRNSRNAHEYLMKLYRKANKRMTRLITGSKNKESYKSMYRGLRDFARMDDFDYDDDDDEVDAYFDNTDEFGDSDFADACLEAYRNGKTPPEIDLESRNIAGFSYSLTGNDKILKEIAAIEAKIGRHLTDAELDKLLCGDDDDDESDVDYRDINSVKDDSDDMINSIADAIYDRVIKKLEGNVIKTNNISSYETLDDFLNNEENTKPVEYNNRESVTVADNTDIPGNASTETLIGIHNKLKNDIPIEENNSAKEDVSSDSNQTMKDDSDDESDSLPPDSSLGGKYNEADFIDVRNSDDDDEDGGHVIYDDATETSEESSEDNSSEELIATENECPPHMQNALIISDIINDFSLSDANITDQFRNRLSNYLERIDISLIDLFISIMPSSVKDTLFTIVITARVTGDYEIINMMHLNMVVLMYTKSISERLGISEDLIATEFNIVDAGNSFDSDLKLLNTNSKDFTANAVDNLYSALSAITAYIYRRLNKIVEVRFINDPNSKDIDIYFYDKSDEPLGSDFVNFLDDELKGQGILDEVMTSFNINYNVDYTILDNVEDYLNILRTVLNHHIIESPIIKKYITTNEEFITNEIGSHDINVDSIYDSAGISISRSSVVIDIIYHIYTDNELSSFIKSEFEKQFEINGEYAIQLESIIKAISGNAQVNNFISYTVSTTDDEDDENASDDNQKTSNFGI